MEIRSLLERIEAADVLRDSLRISEAEVIKFKSLAEVAAAQAHIAKSYMVGLRNQLEGYCSEKGELLAEIGSVRVYEFWLKLPTYSGPITGASARLSQHGDVHQVSDVKGTTKGGLGGAAVGAVLLGPAGAIVGAVASRKTTVNTEVRTVDTRQFELEVIGPGYAWSTSGNPSLQNTLKKVRDAVNARGTNTDNVEDVTQAAMTKKTEAIKDASAACDRATDISESAVLSLAASLASHQKNFDKYFDRRLPLWDDLRIRVSRSNIWLRVFLFFIGPILLAGAAGYKSLLFTSHQGDMNEGYAVLSAVVFVLFAYGYMIYYYFDELRPPQKKFERFD